MICFALSETDFRHTVQLEQYILDRKALHPAPQITLCPRLAILEMSLFNLFGSLGRRKLAEKRQYDRCCGLCTATYLPRTHTQHDHLVGFDSGRVLRVIFKC